jgi:peptidyl-prolyl cis-trans isomerase C
MLAVAFTLMLSACSSDNDILRSSQVLARVGDKEITTTYFERQLAGLPESLQKLSTHGQGKKAALEGLVNKEILYAEALKKKVDKDAEIERKFEDVKKELVISTYLQNEIISRIKVADKEVEAFYKTNPSEFKNREEIRISQIVVPDEAKAQEILDKIKIRRDFGDLAANYSIDKASAANKGDVGYYTYKRLPDEVRESVFKLKVGEISKPYKMPGGYYEIYKITDRRTVSFTFDQVKDSIRTQIFDDKFNKELVTLLDGLKKNTTVQINEALLK